MKILYANTIDYEFDLKQRPQHLMDVLSSRGHKVYWVNNTKIDGKSKDIINENFELYHNWNQFLRRVPKVDVYFSSWSHRHVDLDFIKHDVVVYDSLDNFPENCSQEHLMINRADIVLTASQPLYNLRKKEHHNVHLCRNACFPELGEVKYQMPDDLKNLKRPIILFSGALANWCDLELVDKVSKKYTTVFVGKPWGIPNSFKDLIYLGKKDYHKLQAYYANCDVSILPFKRCQTSDYSNPIKNYEAMVHGKITVATDIPEATIYKNVVLPSKNHSEFLSNIDLALRMSTNQKNIERCKEIAKDNSWYSRVDIIENTIKKFCEENEILLS